MNIRLLDQLSITDLHHQSLGGAAKSHVREFMAELAGNHAQDQDALFLILKEDETLFSNHAHLLKLSYLMEVVECEEDKKNLEKLMQALFTLYIYKLHQHLFNIKLEELTDFHEVLNEYTLSQYKRYQVARARHKHIDDQVTAIKPLIDVIMNFKFADLYLNDAVAFTCKRLVLDDVEQATKFNLVHDMLETQARFAKFIEKIQSFPVRNNGYTANAHLIMDAPIPQVRSPRQLKDGRIMYLAAACNQYAVHLTHEILSSFPYKGYSIIYQINKQTLSTQYKTALTQNNPKAGDAIAKLEVVVKLRKELNRIKDSSELSQFKKMYKDNKALLSQRRDTKTDIFLKSIATGLCVLSVVGMFYIPRIWHVDGQHFRQQVKSGLYGLTV